MCSPNTTMTLFGAYALYSFNKAVSLYEMLTAHSQSKIKISVPEY